MIEQVTDQERGPVEIILGQDRAYELRMVREDGKDSARCIVMGTDRPETLTLSPGTYAIHLRQLSDVPTRTLSRNVEISKDTRTLNLSELFQNSFDSSQFKPISSPQITELTKAVRQSKKRKRLSSKELNFLENEQLTFQTLSQVRATNELSRLDQGMPAPRFEIGISHNYVNSSSGWRSASKLSIEHNTAGDGTLSLTIRDDDHDLDAGHRRVRLTLAIEGRSAIRAPLPLFRDGVRVSVAPLWVDDEPDGLIRIESVNPRKQALVAALSSLGDDDAMSVLKWSADTDGSDAMEMLLYKKNDLWAATVAALLLAKTYQLKDVAQWAYNLEKFAPHISDAGVTAAWARASDLSINLHESEQLTLKHLVRSRKIGAPTFKVTHSIALELLNALRGSSKSADLRDKARHEMSIWTRRASRRLFKGPYIMWEQAGENLQSGRLPSGRYKRVARGLLERNGFFIRNEP